MSADANGLFLVGRLTKDADSKQIGEGTVTEFRLAFSTREKRGGEWSDQSNFIGCSMWGSTGVIPYLTKGRQVAITGQLVYREWEKDGQKRSVNEVRVRDLQLLGEGKGSGNGGGGDLPVASVGGSSAADDSIPF